MGPQQQLADVTKTVTVPVPVEEAFRILVEKAQEWTPPAHMFLPDATHVEIEPGVGGRFYERDAAGTEAVHGVVYEWSPPTRMVLTWRVGANWQPIHDDERASFIEFTFTGLTAGSTRVDLTHSQFHRHGEPAAAIRAAVDGPSPGETLSRYADVVARHADDPAPSH